MAQTPHTQSMNIGDGNSNCGNITASFNTTFYKSDEDAQILRWLSPLEPNHRHHGVRNDRFAGIEDFEQLLGWLGAVDPILSYRTAQNLY